MKMTHDYKHSKSSNIKITIFKTTDMNLALVTFSQHQEYHKKMMPSEIFHYLNMVRTIFSGTLKHYLQANPSSFFE